MQIFAQLQPQGVTLRYGWHSQAEAMSIAATASHSQLASYSSAAPSRAFPLRTTVSSSLLLTILANPAAEASSIARTPPDGCPSRSRPWCGTKTVLVITSRWTSRDQNNLTATVMSSAAATCLDTPSKAALPLCKLGGLLTAL